MLKVSERLQTELKHWLVSIIIRRRPYFLGHSMQRGHIFEIDEAPVRRWAQRNPFTLSPSHSIGSGDANQLPVFPFTKNTLDADPREAGGSSH